MMRAVTSSVMTSTGRRCRKEKSTSIRRIFFICLCSILIFVCFAPSIAHWFSVLPDLATLRLSSEAANAHKSCKNFTDFEKEKHNSANLLPEGERYLWYSPHDGFSNQARELRNALRIAMLLNRTLILPPVVDHGTVKHGRCLKPRANQRRLREKSWSSISTHIMQSRYVSIGDIVDLSEISPSMVKIIDLRVFLALWCGLSIGQLCSGPICSDWADALEPQHWGSLKTCTSRLLPPPENPSCLLYEIDNDCPTTIWTYSEDPFTRLVLEEQLMEKLRHDSELHNRGINMVADKLQRITRKDVVQTLGPGSVAESYFLLAFGNLFSRMYKGMELHVDLNEAHGDPGMDAKLQAIAIRPFTQEIVGAAKAFVEHRLPSRPYFCAHVRLGERAFGNVWKKTLTPLKRKLEDLVMSTNDKVDLFLMTDLARVNWTGTFLEEVATSAQYELHSLDGHEDLLSHAAHQMLLQEHAFRIGHLPNVRKGSTATREAKSSFQVEQPLRLPNVRLYLEEVICSCASLGFQGTYRSTVTSNINDMRNAGLCPLGNSQE